LSARAEGGNFRADSDTSPDFFLFNFTPLVQAFSEAIGLKFSDAMPGEVYALVRVAGRMREQVKLYRSRFALLRLGSLSGKTHRLLFASFKKTFAEAAFKPTT